MSGKNEAHSAARGRSILLLCYPIEFLSASPLLCGSFFLDAHHPSVVLIDYCYYYFPWLGAIACV